MGETELIDIFEHISCTKYEETDTDILSPVQDFNDSSASLENFEWDLELLQLPRQGNAVKYSRDLTGYTVFQQQKANPDAFESTSTSIFGTSRHAPLLRLCTYVKMIQDKSLKKVCRKIKVDIESALENVLSQTEYAKPLTLHYLSRATYRNIFTILQHTIPEDQN